MKKPLILLFLLLVSFLPTTVHADFGVKTVDVVVTMNEDGTAKVRETIKFYVRGDESKATYIAGLNNNELSFWTSTLPFSDIRTHINSEVVNVQNFRIIPQPLKKCNAFTEVCEGEIMMDYDALPYYITQGNAKEIIEGTGIFSIDNYKPRTMLFSINDDSLSFETAEVEHIIRLNEYTTLTINLPTGSSVLEVNPVPEDLEDLTFPTSQSTYSWKNTLLVKFSFIYEIEKGLDEEVLEFFQSLYGNFQYLLFGSEGLSIIVILLILFAFYIALTSIDKRKR